MTLSLPELHGYVCNDMYTYIYFVSSSSNVMYASAAECCAILQRSVLVSCMYALQHNDCAYAFLTPCIYATAASVGVWPLVMH
jgi:hypothetical protein